MKRFFLRSVFTLSLVSLVAVGVVGSGPALAADCGDIAGPCSCGDTVVDDKHLSAADPVTTTICGPGPALTLKSGIALDFAGHTIRGGPDFVTTFGVFLENNTSDVVVHGGTIIGTGSGVGGVKIADAHIFGMRFLNLGGAAVNLVRFNVGDVAVDNRVENVLVEDSFGGIVLIGDRNVVQRSTLRNISRGGVAIVGDDNVVFGNRIQDTRDGIRISGGARNRISRNVVVGSDHDGIAFMEEGPPPIANALVELNQVSLSAAHGLRLNGSAHTVTRNVTRNNAQDGIFVGATDSTFSRNQSTANGRFGIEDATSGSGTAGTANAYSLNLCGSANALGPSSPEGLCR